MKDFRLAQETFAKKWAFCWCQQTFSPRISSKASSIMRYPTT